jgi:LuxR family quorum sensing-dependent transcriptional regulator
MPQAALLDYGRHAFEFIERLNSLSNSRDVASHLQNAIAPFDLETVLLMGLPNPEQRFEDIVLARRWPAEWFKTYTESGYVHVDPALRHLKRTAKPFEWSEVRFDPEREPRAKQLMQRRWDFGFRGCLVIPIPGPGGSIACVSLGTMTRFSVSARDRPALHLMAYYGFERAARLRTNNSVNRKRPLTDREREVLHWAAVGKSAWEIGEILAIAERTVTDHVQSACRKLGAVNRTHAVALAMRDGLMSI